MDFLFKLTRIPYEEPYHLQLEVEASNTRQKGYLVYYSSASDLADIGKALSDFPTNDLDEFLYELGSEDPEQRFAHYLRLRFFMTRPTGASGIEVHFSNNEPAPFRELTAFTIPCEVAGLNRLGALFSRFRLLEHTVLEWDGVDGELR